MVYVKINWAFYINVDRGTYVLFVSLTRCMDFTMNGSVVKLYVELYFNFLHNTKQNKITNVCKHITCLVARAALLV